MMPIDVDALEGKKFGVSRFGSGSHIMAYVLAHQRYVMRWEMNQVLYLLILRKSMYCYILNLSLNTVIRLIEGGRRCQNLWCAMTLPHCVLTFNLARLMFSCGR